MEYSIMEWTVGIIVLSLPLMLVSLVIMEILELLNKLSNKTYTIWNVINHIWGALCMNSIWLMILFMNNII